VRQGWRVVACVCLAIGVSSLGGVAVAARPSQTTPTPAGDWVHSVCGALVSWRGDVENAATVATNASQKARKLSGSAKAKQAKQALGEFLGVAINATSTAEGNLRAVGGPPVTSSADVEDGLLASFDQLTTFFQSSRDRAQAVSTKNAKQADRKLSSIAEAMTTQSDEVQNLMNSAVAKDASGELTAAIAAEPQCTDVLGGEA
jgi:hypothetical protein